MTDFAAGDRVRMTAYAASQLSGPQTGVVLGYSKRGWLRVRQDGRKSVNSYEPSFWRPAGPTPSP